MQIVHWKEEPSQGICATKTRFSFEPPISGIFSPAVKKSCRPTSFSSRKERGWFLMPVRFRDSGSSVTRKQSRKVTKMAPDNWSLMGSVTMLVTRKCWTLSWTQMRHDCLKIRPYFFHSKGPFIQIAVANGRNNLPSNCRKRLSSDSPTSGVQKTEWSATLGTSLHFSCNCHVSCHTNATFLQLHGIFMQSVSAHNL